MDCEFCGVIEVCKWVRGFGKEESRGKRILNTRRGMGRLGYNCMIFGSFRDIGNVRGARAGPSLRRSLRPAHQSWRGRLGVMQVRYR